MKHLLFGSAGLVIAIMAVNAGNYGLNLLLAKVLDPALFGDASLMVTVLLITGVLAATLQLTTSVAIVKDPDGRDGSLDAMRLLANRYGFGAALLLGTASPVATALLQIESPWALVTMAAGLPIHMQLAVERGRLQGDLRLGRLAATFIAEGVARTAATLLVVSISPNVTTLAIALNLGFVGGYLLCRPNRGSLSWLDLRRPLDRPPVGSLGATVVAVTLLTNLDVLAAKAVFDPATAGSFAALALGGRIVFFASWTMQQALLPLVIAEESPLSRELRVRLFLAGNATACAVLVAVGWLWADVWVGVAFGGSYPEVVALFGPYAFGTGLIAVAGAIAVIASSAGDDRPGRLLLAGAAAFTLVQLASGETLEAFVHARTGALVAVATGVVIAGRLSTRSPQSGSQKCRSELTGAIS